MGETGQWLLEMRLFKVDPEVREEFDRISREGTIPLMRKCGITVIAHGPSLIDDDVYFLLRAFSSAKERVELSQAVYATAEWEDNYEKPVMGMIDEYHTAVMPASRQMIEEMMAHT